MNWQEQKIKGFEGINESVTANPNEFEVLSNLVTDIVPNELILNTKYEIYKANAKYDYFLFLEAKKRYFVAVDKQGCVFVEIDEKPIKKGQITDYSKENFTFHKVNQSVRFSNGTESWYLGEIDDVIVFEKQFRCDGGFSEAAAYIDLVSDNTASIFTKGEYEFIAIYKIDGYQFVKGAKRKDIIEVNTRLKICFKVSRISKRVNSIYLYYRNINTSVGFTLLFSKDVSDFELAKDDETRIYSQRLAESNTLLESITGVHLGKTPNGIIIFQQESKYYDKDGNLSSFFVGLLKNSNTYSTIINTSDSGVYKFTTEGDFSVFVPFNLLGGKDYRIELDITAYMTKYFTQTIRGSYKYGNPPTDFIVDTYSFELCNLELKNTINFVEYKVNTNSGNVIIDFTPLVSMDGFTLFGSFISDTTDNPIKKRWEDYNQLPMGYLVFNRVLVREYNGLAEQTTISALTGYQISPDTKYVTGWSKAIISNGKTHFLKPVLGDDTTLQKNMICRSLISASGAMMYDVATAGDFLSVESFEGDEIQTAEVLQNGDLLVFKKNTIQRVDSNNRISELSKTHRISNKNSICKAGQGIYFATNNGIYATNGIEVTELSGKIKESFYLLDKKNIIIAVDEKGRIHVSDKSNDELIMTSTGWTKYAQNNTYFLSADFLYLQSGNNIYKTSEILCSGINFLSCPFDTFIVGEFNHITRIILRSAWIYGTYEAIGQPILVIKTEKETIEIELPNTLSGDFSRRIKPINATRVQIGIKGQFKNFKLKSFGFMWKPMVAGING